VDRSGRVVQGEPRALGVRPVLALRRPSRTGAPGDRGSRVHCCPQRARIADPRPFPCKLGAPLGYTKRPRCRWRTLGRDRAGPTPCRRGRPRPRASKSGLPLEAAQHEARVVPAEAERVRGRRVHAGPQRAWTRTPSAFPLQIRNFWGPLEGTIIALLDPKPAAAGTRGEGDAPLWQYFLPLRKKQTRPCAHPKASARRTLGYFPCKAVTSEGAEGGAMGAIIDPSSRRRSRSVPSWWARTCPICGSASGVWRSSARAGSSGSP
jgi:hypothetical protein